MVEFTSASLIKICGVTSEADAQMIVAAGADALGVILTASRRQVDAATARAVVQGVGERLLRFAVVDSRDESSLAALRGGLAVDVVQVHGGLPDALRAELRSMGLAVVAALPVTSPEFSTFDERQVDAVLVDGPAPGSGQAHSFSVLAERRFARPVIAAGGLTPHSVAAVIDAYGVWGVDVASGVESAPGVKDPDRVAEFVGAARRAFERRAAS